MPPGVLAAVLLLAGHPLAALLPAFLALAVAAFFRDPDRRGPGAPESILAPADGRILDVGPAEDLPGGTALSIFLSLFDVHVNRSPVAGRIREVRSWPGRALPAFSPRAAGANRGTELAIDTDRGPVRMRQIAGLVARRVVCWKHPGDPVERGERVGLIRFGSRVELILPAGSRVRVGRGERVRAGETVIGSLPPGRKDG
ncbi:MAG: phosphatidylserine decarboxylase family protein [Acidobacteria bacterium]|nr:phosphatidylserine decarboxylase family protein [Acidobacteriota bacterium]